MYLSFIKAGRTGAGEYAYVWPLKPRTILTVLVQESQTLSLHLGSMYATFEPRRALVSANEIARKVRGGNELHSATQSTQPLQTSSKLRLCVVGSALISKTRWCFCWEETEWSLGFYGLQWIDGSKCSVCLHRFPLKVWETFIFLSWCGQKNTVEKFWICIYQKK